MKKKVLIAEFAFVVLILCLAIYNMIFNDEFFRINVFNILTLAATVMFAFYFTQGMTDDRRAKEMAEKLLRKIQGEISDSRFCNICCEQDIEYLRIKIRTVANDIDCLVQVGQRLDINEETKDISEKFNAYEMLFGNHISQLEHLKNSRVDFKNNLYLVDNKCTYIITSFYK
jgi:hypothetical protein